MTPLEDRRSGRLPCLQDQGGQPPGLGLGGGGEADGAGTHDDDVEVLECCFHASILPSYAAHRLTSCDSYLPLDDMSSVIRSAGMRGFRDVVEQFGGDAEALAAQFGVPLDALDGDDVLVSDVAMARLLEGAARALPCPDLPDRD